MAPPNKGEGFDARLQSALRRAGTVGKAADRPAEAPKDWNAMPTNAWGIGGRVGVELVSAFIAGTLFGWLLDRWLHTRPLFLILGVVFGGAAGVWNVWRLMKR